MVPPRMARSSPPHCPSTRSRKRKRASGSTSPRARPPRRRSSDGEDRAMSLNKAMIIGNLGRDPEMRYTPNGQAVTQFTVAVNRNFRGQDGEWQEETEWFRVVAW